MSISPTFYEQLLCKKPFAKKWKTQIVSTEKLRKKLSYEKAARKILVKSTPGCFSTLFVVFFLCFIIKNFVNFLKYLTFYTKFQNLFFYFFNIKNLIFTILLVWNYLVIYYINLMNFDVSWFFKLYIFAFSYFYNFLLLKLERVLLSEYRGAE